MSTIHQYLLAIGSFQGIVLFHLLFFDSRMSAASKVLGWCCLMLGLFFILPFITSGMVTESLYPLAGWLFFLPVLFGPMIYLYCRKVVFNEPFKGTDWLHFLPLPACYLFNADALFLYHEEIRLWIVGDSAPTWRVWLSEYILFIVAFVYTVAAAFVIKSYHQRALDNYSNFNPVVFKWLGLLVAASIVVWFGKALMSFTDSMVAEMIVISDGLIVIMIYLIALTQWRNPRIFTVDCTQNGSVPPLKSPPDSYAQTQSGGVMDDELRNSLYQTLVIEFEKNALHRDSQLTLTKLAQLTGISIHQLSEVLNKHAGKNFNQFVNAYRIEEVCDRLESNSTEKLLDIAFEAGFSSKSTFNTLFKKSTGLTPTRYKQQHTKPK